MIPNYIMYTSPFHMLMVLSIMIHAAQAHDTGMDLLRRIEALELQGQMQQNRIDQQDKLLKEQDKQVASYKVKMKGYENELREHTNKIQQLEDELAKFTNNRANLPRLVLANDERPVAFHATIDKGITSGIGLNQHIIFEDVQLNLGNAFHQLHGLFIAPKSGIYLFSTTIMIQPDQHEILATIVKNGAELARAYANGAANVADQGSVTIVTQLSIGDEVWVSSYARQSASDYGDKFSSFMGVLLIES